MLARHKLVRRLLIGLSAGLVVLGAGVIPGCAGCKGKAPLNYVPADAVMVFVMPSISEGMRETRTLIDKFREQQLVKMALDAAKGQVTKELGIDPEKPETLKAKGINPDGGLVASLGADGQAVVVAFAIEDAKAVEKFLREMATKAMGGSATFQEKDVGGVKMTLLAIQGMDKPRAAWTYTKDHIVLCLSAKEGKVGEHLAGAVKQEANIKSNKTFTALQNKVGKHQLFFYLDGPAMNKMQAAKDEERLKASSDWLKKYVKERADAREQVMAWFRGAAYAARVSPEGVTLRSYLAVPTEKGKAIREMLKGTGDAPDFGKYIGPEALAVGRFSLNAKKLLDLLQEIFPAAAKRGIYSTMDRIERETRVNVEKDILALLGGRYAWALYPPPAAALKEGPPREMRQFMRLISMIGMAQVTDPAKAGEMLQKLEQVLVMARVDVKTRSEGTRKLYTVEDDGKPLISWTLVKNLVVVGAADRVAQSVKLVEQGGDNVLSTVDASRAKSLLKSDDGMVFYYNVSKTADVIRALDLGPEIKAMLATPLATISKFADITMSGEVDDEGILGELSVRVK